MLIPGAVRVAARAPGAPGLGEPAAPVRPSRLAPALGLRQLVPGSLGVRMDAEPGHGRTAVPVRSALAGTALAVAAVVAAMDTRRELPRAGRHAALIRAELGPSSLICRSGPCPPARAGGSWRTSAAWSSTRGATMGGSTVSGGGSGAAVPAIGIDQLHGRGFLTLLTGHAPAGPRQITLGPRTLRCSVCMSGSGSGSARTAAHR